MFARQRDEVSERANKQVYTKHRQTNPKQASKSSRACMHIYRASIPSSSQCPCAPARSASERTTKKTAARTQSGRAHTTFDARERETETRHRQTNHNQQTNNKQNERVAQNPDLRRKRLARARQTASAGNSAKSHPQPTISITQPASSTRTTPHHTQQKTRHIYTHNRKANNHCLCVGILREFAWWLEEWRDTLTFGE